MKLITIVVDTSTQFVAEQRSQNLWFLTAMFVAAVLGLAFYLIKIRAWKWLVGPALLLPIILLIFSDIGHHLVYRVAIEKQSHLITCEQIVNGQLTSTVVIPSSDITSAEIQFNRSARIIALVHRDGHLSYPLGQEQVTNEPDQYVVLNALRSTIGQIPTEPAVN